ncbi:hypothetical protein TREMEDRAFT_59479 [Tremella mesenterica DSM 1558]|uniref:uncharacterized protein n=1 Tax=Tremella mesenterica (strain ATCC 24925 / CBS 8224 / DSM 1558 / NBRC 9311 / NRRL Y-6157 / RJB 2259-6 / UBC 559-6) TaxID=578456 RepID=UPI0003F4A588|nr:uncharacterized protein TREMEDRAFT_59479 [Tremella mesenterica DSM 1558]EIW73315.1 hypothetical protein TREMEDRAFT_59479 [Tremella mesenterica DSM 1558]
MRSPLKHLSRVFAGIKKYELELPVKHIYLAFDGSSLGLVNEYVRAGSNGGKAAMDTIRSVLTAISGSLRRLDSGAHIVIYEDWASPPAQGRLRIRKDDLPEAVPGQAPAQVEGVLLLKNDDHSSFMSAFINEAKTSLVTELDPGWLLWAAPRPKSSLTVLVTNNLEGITPKVKKLKQMGKNIVILTGRRPDKLSKVLGITVISIEGLFK